MRFDNAMGEEAEIYAGTAAVMDIEIVIPVAVNFPDFIVSDSYDYPILSHCLR